jgi:hypothetical protein
MDEASLTPEGLKQMSYTRIKRIKNWRTKESSSFDAYVQKLLRPNDYKWINSMAISFFLFVVLGVALFND